MKPTEALARLESMGTAQNRKVYARHGVLGPAFGVSYANLDKLTKGIGLDHALAEALWRSGNHDARVLATRVADPARAGAKLLGAWLKDVDSYPLAGALAELVARTSSAGTLAKKWIAREGEWPTSTGWQVFGHLCDSGALEEETCRELLHVIEETLATSPNRTRYAMNSALIAIGCSGGELQRLAVAAAKRIGPVEVDHGETGCKTPDAAGYIAKVVAYRSKKRKQA